MQQIIIFLFTTQYAANLSTVDIGLLLIGIVVLALEWFFSKKGWSPVLSFVLILSIIGLVFYRLFSNINHYLSILLSCSSISLLCALIFSPFEHPLLREIRKEMNDVFEVTLNAWIKLPLPFHRCIVIAYATLLIAFSPSNINAAGKRK